MGSGDPAALRQLMDMGIPRMRAKAALVKAKDDVATAAVSHLICQASFANTVREAQSIA